MDSVYLGGIYLNEGRSIYYEIFKNQPDWGFNYLHRIAILKPNTIIYQDTLMINSIKTGDDYSFVRYYVNYEKQLKKVMNYKTYDDLGYVNEKSIIEIKDFKKSSLDSLIKKYKIENPMIESDLHIKE
jgi:hypothetical protein